MRPSSLFVTSKDGTRIWAEAAGNPSKPAVVFIHGFGFATFAFDKQFLDPKLLAGLYLIRYDMRSHGRSDKPEVAEAYESIKFAEDFKAVCDAFGVVKPFIAGWSLGGGIVVDILEAYGAKFIGGAIYCGGTVLTRPIHQDYATPFLLDLIPDLLSDDGNVLTRAGVEFMRACILDSEKKLAFETEIQWIGSLSLMSPLVRTLLLSREQRAEKWAKEIKELPVLIIHGDQDSMVDADKLREAARASLGNYRFVQVEGVGHFPCYEEAAETNVHILHFVEEMSVE